MTPHHGDRAEGPHGEGGVATAALYFLSSVPELCQPMGLPVEGGATHQAKAVMSRAKKKEG